MNRHVSASGAVFGFLLSLVAGAGVGVGVYFGLLVTANVILAAVPEQTIRWMLFSSMGLGLATTFAVLAIVAVVDGVRGALIALSPRN